MAHENQGIRYTGDLYLFRNVAGVEQPGLGPLAAEMLSFQPTSERIEVKDKRRNRRGQLLYVVADPQPTTGSLTLLSVPTEILSMLYMGDAAPLSGPAGSLSAAVSGLSPDFWTPLGGENLTSVVVTGGAAATLNTGSEGADTGLTWTAKAVGAGGNDISVTLVNPGADGPLGVAVSGTDITVTLAYATAAVTSTADDVRLAVNASPAASALVTVTDTGESDGTGIVGAVTKTSLSGGGSGGTTYTLNTHYELDAALGLIRPILGGGLPSSVWVAASVGAPTGRRIRVGTDITVRARLLMRMTNDVSGLDDTVECYSALMTPKGETDLLGDEPLKAEFDLAFETPAGKDHPIRFDRAA